MQKSNAHCFVLVKIFCGHSALTSHFGELYMPMCTQRERERERDVGYARSKFIKTYLTPESEFLR
jgi:hypothetical protein